MAISADSIGLLFRIRADSKDAQADIKSLRKTFDDETKAIEKGAGGAFLRLGQSAGLSGERMAQLKAGLTAAASAAAIAGTAAIAAGAAIFTLTKRASDAGSEIFEFAQRTNLSTEFLSALKIQAEQSGSSLSSAAANVTKFSNSLVDAARGNKELTADLQRFGIDASNAYRNTEASVRAFIEQFNKLPPSAANNEAAMRLFKDRTGAIIPVLRSFGTDIDGLMRRLGEMGLLWDKEGTEKADEFGDALTELGQAASGMSNVFAREVMPVITSAMKEMSKAAVENKAKFKEWGSAVGDTIRGVRELADSNFGTVVGWLAKVAYYTTPLAMLVNQTRQIGAQAGDAAALKNFGPFGGRGVETPLTQGRPASTPLAPADVTNENARKAAEAALNKAQREAERESERQAGVVKKLAEEFKRLAAEIKHFNDTEVEQKIAMERLNSGVETLTGNYRRQAEELLRLNAEQIRTLAFKEQLKKWHEEVQQAEREWESRRNAAFDAVRDALRSEIAILTDENTHLREINDTIQRAEVLNAIDARTAAFLRQLAAVNAISDKMEDVSPVGGDVTVPQAPGQAGGPRVTENVGQPPTGAWTEFGQVVADVSNRIGEVVGVSGSVVSSVFSGMAEAVGQTVRAFGGLAGVVKNLGEFTKAVVRNIAVMAGINALWEAAQGVAALALSFFWPSMAVKAKLHFKAAAMYGVVALGAGALSAAIGGPSGGGTGAGGALGGANFAAGGGTDGREDFRTRYLREQEEKDRYTRREDRRGDVVLVIDNREVARAALNAVRDGGDLRDGFRNAFAT